MLDHDRMAPELPSIQPPDTSYPTNPTNKKTVYTKESLYKKSSWWWVNQAILLKKYQFSQIGEHLTPKSGRE